VAEFRIRQRLDPDVATREYIERFPQWQTELDQRLTSVSPVERNQGLSTRLNCPHCHNPIAIVDVGDADDVVCPSCGSSFHVDADRRFDSATGKLPELGKFRLLEEVGRGSFGTVYRAVDTELDRTVAIKVPRRGAFGSQEEEDRFLREAKSAARLSHPGIVPVYEVGRTKVCPFIVSELVDGLTLGQLLAERRIGTRESAHLVLSLTSALEPVNAACER